MSEFTLCCSKTLSLSLDHAVSALRAALRY